MNCHLFIIFNTLLFLIHYYFLLLFTSQCILLLNVFYCLMPLDRLSKLSFAESILRFRSFIDSFMSGDVNPDVSMPFADSEALLLFSLACFIPSLIRAICASISSNDSSYRIKLLPPWDVILSGPIVSCPSSIRGHP